MPRSVFLCGAGAVLLWVATATGAGVAYLPKVGPSSIVFQAPPPAPCRLLAAFPIAPAPAPTNAPASTNPPSPALTNAAATVSIGAETILVQSPTRPAAEMADTNAVNQLPALPTAPADGAAITPQMLVPFFYQKQANDKGKEGGVIVPLLFTPPRPGSQPSSKAALKTD